MKYSIMCYLNCDLAISLSADECAITVCFLLFQDIRELPKKQKQKPVVEQQSVTSSAQSKSV